MAKLKSYNPTNGKCIGEVKITTKKKLEEVLEIAKSGFKEWKTVELKKRAEKLNNLAELLDKNKNDLAELMTREMGKPLAEAKNEIQSAINNIKYVVEIGPKILADDIIRPKLTQANMKKIEKDNVCNRVEYLMNKNEDLVSVLRYAPIGVIAVIKHWNCPINTPLLSIASALIAGNSVIFKPSEYVSLVSRELAKLIWKAGIPNQVFLLIQGRAKVGEMLVDAPVDMVSFTGSTEVGQEIAEKCSERLIKYNLELGGSSAAIVLNGANLELTANAIVGGKFCNNGQASSIKKVIVERTIYRELFERIEEKVRALRVGNPMHKNVDIGPLVSKKQFDKFHEQVTQAVIEGGRIKVGGRIMKNKPFDKGYFHEPTVIVYLREKMKIMQEEVFGPLLPIIEVKNVKEAVKIANNTKFGLTVLLFTRSKTKITETIPKLEAGSIYVNDSMALYPESPWTGLKNSGFGTQKGKHGIWEYTHKTHVHVDKTSNIRKDYWFPY